MAQIVCFADVGHSAGVRAAIDKVFFDNAATSEFSDEVSRRDYHDLWLGRYLRHFPESCWIAFEENNDNAIIGYLAGSLVSDTPPLPGPDYYRQFPSNFIEKFPAHLHINIRQDRHVQGTGRALIDAFRTHCHEKQMAGFHAVTIASRTPADFFVRCGMTVQARILWSDRRIVFIGEKLDP